MLSFRLVQPVNFVGPLAWSNLWTLYPYFTADSTRVFEVVSRATTLAAPLEQFMDSKLLEMEWMENLGVPLTFLGTEVILQP